MLEAVGRDSAVHCRQDSSFACLSIHNHNIPLQHYLIITRPAPELAFLQVLLAVVRLPQVNSDILITLNTPIYINPASRSAQHVASGHKATHEQAPADFAGLLSTFSVLDWGLFGSPE